MADRIKIDIQKAAERKKFLDANKARIAAASEKIRNSMIVEKTADGKEELATNLHNNRHLLHVAQKYDLYAPVSEIDSITKKLDGELKISSEDEDARISTRQIGYESHNVHFWSQFKDLLPLLNSGLDKVHEEKKHEINDYIVGIPFISMAMHNPGLILITYGGYRPEIIHSYDIVIRYLTVISYIRQSDLHKSFSLEIANWFCSNRRKLIFKRKGNNGPRLLQRKFQELLVSEEMQMKIIKMINKKDEAERDLLRREIGQSIKVTPENFALFNDMKDEKPTEYLEQIDDDMREFRENMMDDFIKTMKAIPEDDEQKMILTITDFNYQFVMSFEMQIFRLLADIIPKGTELNYATDPKKQVKDTQIRKEVSDALIICNDELFESRKKVYNVDVSQYGGQNYVKKLRHFILQFPQF